MAESSFLVYMELQECAVYIWTHFSFYHLVRKRITIFGLGADCINGLLRR